MLKTGDQVMRIGLSSSLSNFKRRISMKKLLALMGLAVAAFSFTGCQKNEMKDADNDFKGTSTLNLLQILRKPRRLLIQIMR